MQTFVIATVLAAAFFANVVVEVAAELGSDALLDDDPGVVAESFMEPRSMLVDMMPDSAVVVWNGRRR